MQIFHMFSKHINVQSFHICERRGNALVREALSWEKTAEYWARMQALSLVSLFSLY